MKIVIAPDAYKECLSAPEVAASMAEGARKGAPEADIVEIPLADGGEGTLDILLSALGGTCRETVVSDPLGRPVTVAYGVASDCAIIEVAKVCGLSLLDKRERNPLVASTRGLGELMADAYRSGCRRFLIGLGGTATCDGGAGMLSVGGIRQVLKESRVELLCDVAAPFVGPEGAARVFAPQKGASAADVEILEGRLTAQAAAMAAETGIDVSAMPGAGAAGGLGGAFMAYAHASFSSGVDRVLDLTGFDKAVRGAGLVITGEGKSDRQTLQGKVPYGVLRRCASLAGSGIRVVLVSGRMVEDDSEALRKAGFQDLVSVSDGCRSLEEAMRPEVAARNIARGVARCLAGAGRFIPGVS